MTIITYTAVSGAYAPDNDDGEANSHAISHDEEGKEACRGGTDRASRSLGSKEGGKEKNALPQS